MKRKNLVYLLLVVFFSFSIMVTGCGSSSKEEVVIYTSADQVFAEAILKDFEKETGIKVKAVYDVEATKTTGLVNRLIAEKNKPQADVFWNSEFAQTLLLKENGVLASYISPSASDIPENFKDTEGMWTAFGGRARIIIVNTEKLSPSEYPSSIKDLLDPRYPPDQLAMAYPMFGTTATHAAALYVAWGPEKAKSFFEQVRDRRVQIVDGNSVVKDMAADGRIIWGLTDTDDAIEAIKKGAPVDIIYPDQEDLGTLIIPNTVAMIKGGPNPEQAKKLIDYLLSPEVEGKLLESGFIQVPCRNLDIEVEWIPEEGIRNMDVDFEEVYLKYTDSRKDMEAIFVR
ncbi:iron(III) transport system substrate-binding protein [Thermosyntropha lipolytica DSM 11003]|uniref:Iron(III) transport system substrate-binding protein n=1 Tax=Thermosyntropha lipolytica DSM 11003 TaxID=1123382 RepID=A0A1M5K2V7_9FIRM|nr:extracellular solute-binding protein [Thermosyntropha lipolytica]SHG47085.1 iron(III) transport system substrate-binding protein [Thermosyntropha lipolytica DSM 11003]